MAEKLEKINKLRDRKAKIVFTDGEEVVCRPLQYLEEDYESYLVEIVEGSTDFPVGELMEIEEDQVKSVEEIK